MKMLANKALAITQILNENKDTVDKSIKLTKQLAAVISETSDDQRTGKKSKQGQPAIS
jgi:hypothetical protein